MAEAETTAAAETIAAIAGAVTGPGTPNNATMHAEPSRRLIWALVLAGPAVSLMVIGCVCILAFKFWPDTISVEQYEISKIIVGAIATVTNVLAALLGLIIFRLASGGLKSVRAQALGGNIEVATGAE